MQRERQKALRDLVRVQSRRHDPEFRKERALVQALAEMYRRCTGAGRSDVDRMFDAFEQRVEDDLDAGEQM
jgi:phytoene/squalene synthetase